MGFSRRRRNVVFDDQRPAWDSSTSDLAQFKLDKEELEVSSSGLFFPSAAPPRVKRGARTLSFFISFF